MSATSWRVTYIESGTHKVQQFCHENLTLTEILDSIKADSNIESLVSLVNRTLDNGGVKCW